MITNDLRSNSLLFIKFMTGDNCTQSCLLIFTKESVLELSANLNTQKTGCNTDLISDIVTQHSLFDSWECVVIHKTEDQLEHSQGVTVVSIPGLGQEGCLDGLPLHTPYMRLWHGYTIVKVSDIYQVSLIHFRIYVHYMGKISKVLFLGYIRLA